ncbi:hypothetical protein CEK26_010705 [Fusarium fujikuroi]|nr:hypothetical protein CEK25_010715 [Fusarium fujikuroi]QGI97636.1 hypothetical protein CEK26_010705 [Fusarium fujikuroi]VTT57386.1 unnamed protein product [Fusarium fujikuroi]VZH97362.1 unnamed protein product [Fusarium fujikuroi]
MSSTTDPNPSDSRPAFIPLEANPELMTTLIHKLGVSNALAMHDVYSLTDPDLLAFIPRPALALLLVFPVSAVYESHRMAEDSLADEYKGKGDTEPVLWWPQTIRNACGLMGLLHAVCNGNARSFIEEDSTLDVLIKKSIPLDPHGRAKVLETTPDLATAHKEAASQGDTPAPAAEDDVELHYVCFAKGTDGGLWELDGRRKGPIRRGDLEDNEDVLSPKGLALGIARWLLGGGREHVGLILGNDASGKTTFLYRLKFGEAVQALPTIGFNVETIDHPDGEKVTLWDVGGCDAIRPLIRHYMTQDRFLIFIQSCTDTDPDRVEFSLEYLRMGMNMMLEYGAKHVFIIFNKQDLLSDEERPKTVKDLKTKIEAEIKPYADKLDIKILDTPGLSALWGCQAYNVMDEIRKTLTPKNAANDTKAEIELREKGPSEEELRNKIRTANAESANASTFWKSFLDGTLEAWDHYTHLRAGFFVMHDCFGRGLGLLECADEFMKHLNRLREGIPERFRNTAHKTMTIFWLHQIQVAAIEYQAHSLDKFPSREDYADIVFSAPHLMNSGLWRTYYSKDLLFSQLARNNYSLPDLQPLPTIKQVTSAPLQEKVTNYVDRLPRFAFSVVQKTLSSKLRRGGVVKQALEALQSSTMRLRASDSSVPPYSETQAYFWIQIIHAYTRSLEVESSQSQFTTYEAFKSLFGINGDEWKEYYSQSTWESIAARMTFVNPDKKPLPNIFNLPSQARKDLAISQMINATNHRSANTDLPPSEDLDFLASILIDEAKLIPESELNVASHASLITFLFNRLTQKTKSAATSTKRGDASLASSTALEIAKWTGLTQAMFWVQQIQVALAGRKDMSFEEFIKGNSVLAFEELPFVYYSPQLWGSVEARDGYVMPDRRRLSSIVTGKVRQ